MRNVIRVLAYVAAVLGALGALGLTLYIGVVFMVMHAPWAGEAVSASTALYIALSCLLISGSWFLSLRHGDAQASRDFINKVGDLARQLNGYRGSINLPKDVEFSDRSSKIIWIYLQGYVVTCQVNNPGEGVYVHVSSFVDGMIHNVERNWQLRSAERKLMRALKNIPQQ